MGSDFDVAFRIKFNWAFKSAGAWKRQDILETVSQLPSPVGTIVNTSLSEKRCPPTGWSGSTRG
jgi:hypothetical protein